MPKATNQISLKATATAKITRRDGSVEYVKARDVTLIVEPHEPPAPVVETAEDGDKGAIE